MVTTPAHAARRGFTFFDLLVGLALASMTTVAGMTALQQQWERDSRIKCGHNLRLIGQAMRLYSLDDVRGGGFPRTSYNFRTADEPVFATPYADEPDLDAREGVDPFATPEVVEKHPDRAEIARYTPKENDVTAAMFHLMRVSDLTPSAFICASTRRQSLGDRRGFVLSQYTNWPGTEALRDHLSYSFQNMYFSENAISRGAKWTDSLPSTHVIAADMNPGTDEALTATTESIADAAWDQPQLFNSPNHFGYGQNVLFADGSVRFVEKPLAGPMKDNIYNYRDAEPVILEDRNSPPPGADAGAVPGAGFIGSAFDRFDNILLPTAKQIEQPAVELPSDEEIEAMQ